jgi:7-cyano-7-deazaguanine synthase in queuosine biosynthesis
MHDRALVLFSGGQDSTTCLAWALDRLAHVETVGSDLGGAALLKIIRRDTHSCYLGERNEHAWGAGCGHCPAYERRAAGWARWHRKAPG